MWTTCLFSTVDTLTRLPADADVSAFSFCCKWPTADSSYHESADPSLTWFIRQPINQIISYSVRLKYLYERSFLPLSRFRQAMEATICFPRFFLKSLTHSWAPVLELSVFPKDTLTQTECRFVLPAGPTHYCTTSEQWTLWLIG